MLWTDKGHQYEKIMQVIKKLTADKEVRYYFWGLGRMAPDIYKYLEDKINITAFIDEDNKKRETNEYNIPVLSPAEISVNHDGIKYLVSRGCYLPAKQMLEKYGMQENIDFFDSSLFAGVYSLIENKIYMYEIELMITGKCSLKCQKCCNFMPYYKEPVHRTWQEIKDDIDIFFKRISYVSRFVILGGEPFLHPDFKEILAYLEENYNNQFDKIFIYTNGTLPLKGETAKLMESSNIHVNISNYSSEELNYEHKLQNLEDVLKQHHISYEITKFDSWVDLIFPKETYTEMDPYDNFVRCNNPCRGIYDKKLWYCLSNCSAVAGGIWKKDSNDFFDIDNQWNANEFLEFNFGYSRIGYTTLCKKCYGWNQREAISPAAQL